MSLTAVIVSPNARTTAQLTDRLNEQRLVRIIRTFGDYPSIAEMTRFIQTTGPSIVFLSTDDPHPATELAAAIDRSGTGTQVVAVECTCEPQVLIEIMRAGTREVLSLPLDPERLEQAIRRVEEILERKPLSFRSTDEVFSFLPAKPGGGASTLALNVASALARRPGCRTLLADFDLNCGMISFLLKITAGHSILDAVEASTNLDEMIWKNLVEKRDNLHVLPSGRLNPDNTIDPEAAIDVITFARRCYDAICIDLSGNMEPYSIELLRQSKKIFLVCAAEMPSLHLARAKTQFLRSIGLHERVSVLLNRADRSSAFSIQEVEEILGAPVRFAFMNDPRRVSSALKEGTCVNPKSDLGHQFELFSTSVIAPTDGSKPVTEVRNKRRFVEYFSIVPAKYTTERNG